MSWVRLDDRFPSHRKVALLSDRAFRLHVSAICWCSENLTDGHIRERELTLVAHVRGLKATARELEEAGVWDRVEDGWVVHDYLAYNPSREQVIAERKKNAARQEAFRKRRSGKPTPPPKGASNGGSNGVTRTEAEPRNDTTATRRRHEDDMSASSKYRDSEEEPQVSEVRNGVTNGAPSRPVPNYLSMADVDGGSTGSSAAADGALAPPPIDLDGFALTDAMRRWAHRDGYAPLVDLDYETAQFVSHFRATHQRRANWADEWQKWIRRSHKWATEQRTLPAAAGAENVVPLTRRPSTTDQRVNAALSLAAEFRALEEGPQP